MVGLSIGGMHFADHSCFLLFIRLPLSLSWGECDHPYLLRRGECDHPYLSWGECDHPYLLRRGECDQPYLSWGECNHPYLLRKLPDVKLWSLFLSHFLLHSCFHIIASSADVISSSVDGFDAPLSCLSSSNFFICKDC